VLSQGISVHELMLYQSALGACYMLVICLLDGTLFAGLGLVFGDAAVSLTLLSWAAALTAGTELVLK
jgi:hypothetical protein